MIVPDGIIGVETLHPCNSVDLIYSEQVMVRNSRRWKSRKHTAASVKKIQLNPDIYALQLMTNGSNHGMGDLFIRDEYHMLTTDLQCKYTIQRLNNQLK